MWARLRFIPILFFLAVSTACTWGHSKSSPPLPVFKSVAIESLGVTDELKARFAVAPEKASTGREIAIGYNTGSLVGAGTALACGPFVLLCATFTVPIGSIVGAAGGVVAEVAADTQKNPTTEQLLVLDKLFVEISQQRTIHMEIRDTLEQEIPPDRLVDKPEADALLQLNLSDARFTRTFSGNYALTLKSILVAHWNRKSRQTRYSHKIYQYTSESLSLDDWVQNDGELLKQAFDDSVEGLVDQMVEDIWFKAP